MIVGMSCVAAHAFGERLRSIRPCLTRSAAIVEHTAHVAVGLSA
jgi:hypothetical protein